MKVKGQTKAAILKAKAEQAAAAAAASAKKREAVAAETAAAAAAAAVQTDENAKSAKSTSKSGANGGGSSKKSAEDAELTRLMAVLGLDERKSVPEVTDAWLQGASKQALVEWLQVRRERTVLARRYGNPLSSLRRCICAEIRIPCSASHALHRPVKACISCHSSQRKGTA
jgi:hypothetical protein